MVKAHVIDCVADDLYATVESLDQAIARATTLVQSMFGSRPLLNLSACAVAEAQSKALEAIAAMGAARQALVSCHEELAKDHRRLGYGVYSRGFDDKPKETTRPTGVLRAV